MKRFTAPLVSAVLIAVAAPAFSWGSGEETSGKISGSNPAIKLGQPGFTEADFAAECKFPPSSQGVDGWVFRLSDSLSGSATAAVTGGSRADYDLDAYFYTLDCTRLAAASMATASPDESGNVPPSARYLMVSAASGAVIDVYLDVRDAATPSPTPAPTLAPSPTATATAVPSPTATPIATATAVQEPSATPTASPTETATATQEATATATSSATAVATATPIQTSTASATATATAESAIPTATVRPAETATGTPTVAASPADSEGQRGVSDGCDVPAAVERQSGSSRGLPLEIPAVLRVWPARARTALPIKMTARVPIRGLQLRLTQKRRSRTLATGRLSCASGPAVISVKAVGALRTGCYTLEVTGLVGGRSASERRPLTIVVGPRKTARTISKSRGRSCH